MNKEHEALEKIKNKRHFIDSLSCEKHNKKDLYTELKLAIYIAEQALAEPKECDIKNGNFYCHYENGNLLGKCQILDDGSICNLFVDKKYRQQGIASGLLKLAVHNGYKYLASVKENVMFYVHQGFKVYKVEYSKEFNANLYYMVHRQEKTFTLAEIREVIFRIFEEDVSFGGCPYPKKGCPKHNDCRECLLKEFERTDK